MSKKHHGPEWWKLQRTVKPRLLAALPAPCPRCGGVMVRGMKLDLGEVQSGARIDQRVRLEHRSCNRRAGQAVTTAKKLSKANRERMPKW